MRSPEFGFELANSFENEPREQCAVFGIYAPNEDVASLCVAGLQEQQNRGQESSGIIVSDGVEMRGVWGTGEVRRVYGGRLTREGYDGELIAEFSDKDHLPSLVNSICGIGHNRYGTTGSSRIENAGPFLVKGIGLAHNGNLTNAILLKEIVKNRGCKVRGTTDSEPLSHLIASEPGDTWEEKIISALEQAEGSYSLVMTTKERIYAVKDRMGNRPLCLGKLGEKGWVVASESRAIKNIGGTYVRELSAGEFLVIDEKGPRTFYQREENLAHCGFEPTYLMNPDSLWYEKEVAKLRFRGGRLLARYYPVEGADAVSAVPYSAVTAAYGYSLESGVPYFETLYKDRWLGRIFMDPDQQMRVIRTGKYSLLPEVMRERRIGRLVLIDDSIVRGTTQMGVVRLYKREFPDLELHLRFLWSQIRYSCFLGTDFATKKQLFYNNFSSDEEAAKALGVASLAHLTEEQIAEAFETPSEHICFACVNGKQPVEITEQMDKFHLEKHSSSTV